MKFFTGVPSGSELSREKLKAQKEVGEEKETERAEEQKEKEEMAFGLQEMTVSFHDRAMVRPFKLFVLLFSSVPFIWSKFVPFTFKNQSLLQTF